MAEADSGRRWREEERETGLLGRRGLRKLDRRPDNASGRETTEIRPLPAAERWHDASNRNSGHEARRDSKWSSRWGPEDKDKEARPEKKMDIEKEDPQNDNQPFVVTNRPVPEREPESRDKWRPRHRMEGASGGAGSYRAAPGFGPERGRVEGSNTGFAVGRGRSGGAISRPPSAESFPGKPHSSGNLFYYPSGKLLDIYCRQMPDAAFTNMPDNMEKVPSITQVTAMEPLAFVVPDPEEEVSCTYLS